MGMTTVQKCLLALGIPSIAALLYVLVFKKDDEDEDVPRVMKVDQTVLRVEVPKIAVGNVIGRQGVSIKKIKDVTGAKLNFEDESHDDKGDIPRMLIIRGTNWSAQQAEIMVRQIIHDTPVLLEKRILIPKSVVGKFIGRGGCNIRDMIAASQCKIIVDKEHGDRYSKNPQLIILKGTHQQITTAKGLIQDLLKKEAENRVKFRNIRGVRRVEDVAELVITEVADTPAAGGSQWNDSVPRQVTWPDTSQRVQVFVSAVHNNGTLWVQLIDESGLQLERLVKDMTSHYDDLPPLSETICYEVGNLVAAKFYEDELWYRARVTSITDNGKTVNLLFVDYGDTQTVTAGELRKLEKEFLKLALQAVQVSLQSCSGGGGDACWSEQKVIQIQDITHCGLWKALHATCNDPSSATPELVLYDEGRNINELIIRHFLAEKATVCSEENVVPEGEASLQIDEEADSCLWNKDETPLECSVKETSLCED